MEAVTRETTVSVTAASQNPPTTALPSGTVSNNGEKNPGTFETVVITQPDSTAPVPPGTVTDADIASTEKCAWGSCAGCCIPLGAIAVYFAYKAKKADTQDDKKRFNKLSIIFSSVSILLGCLIYIIAVSLRFALL